MLILCVNVMECPITWSHIILDVSVRVLGVSGETALRNSGLRKGGCPFQCRGLIQSAEDLNRTTLTFPQTRGNSSCRTAFEPGHPRFLPLDSNLNLSSSHILSLWPPDGNHTSSNLGSSWPSAGPQTWSLCDHLSQIQIINCKEVHVSAHTHTQTSFCFCFLENSNTHTYICIYFYVIQICWKTGLHTNISHFNATGFILVFSPSMCVPPSLTLRNLVPITLTYSPLGRDCVISKHHCCPLPPSPRIGGFLSLPGLRRHLQSCHHCRPHSSHPPAHSGTASNWTVNYVGSTTTMWMLPTLGGMTSYTIFSTI